MNEEFLNESKKVANQFIKNILFVDDQIKWEEPDTDIHDLNAKTLIFEFAKAGKSCTFYNVEEERDLAIEEKTILEIVANSDVIVLDWKMKHEFIGQEQDEIEDPEDDVNEEESRGKFTLQLLCSLISKYKDSLKLILILTGETGGSAILDAIHKTQQFNNFQKDEDNFSLLYEKIKISVYFKPELLGKHGTESISEKIIPNYQSLTNIIDEEFASFTGGLISNTALKTISTIRDNASKLLKVYRKELDPAYLAHRTLLDIPENAEDLLRETILHSIINLINTNDISDKCDMESIEKWIFSISSFKNSSISISNNSINLAGTNPRQVLLKEGFIDGIKKLWTEQKKQGTPSKSAIDKLLLKSINYFIPTDNNHSDINEDFAILTHQKEYFNGPHFNPRLTLGTVIKNNIDGQDNYFICVQPLCDTIRIKDENNNFLFLPLRESKKSGETKIIVKISDGNYLKLTPVYKANSLKMIKFKLTESRDVIVATDYKFIEEKGETEHKYTWVLDLKDNHAQRIANEFGAYISRVGLDESEWLRRS